MPETEHFVSFDVQRKDYYNKEERAEYNRDYYSANKETQREKARQYYRANRDKILARKRMRRALEKLSQAGSETLENLLKDTDTDFLKKNS